MPDEGDLLEVEFLIEEILSKNYEIKISNVGGYVRLYSDINYGVYLDINDIESDPDHDTDLEIFVNINYPSEGRKFNANFDHIFCDGYNESENIKNELKSFLALIRL